MVVVTGDPLLWVYLFQTTLPYLHIALLVLFSDTRLDSILDVCEGVKKSENVPDLKENSGHVQHISLLFQLPKC